MHADRRADEIVVEEMRQLPGGRLPAHLPDLPRARLAVLDVAFGRVVVVAGLCRPRRVDGGVERPVRQVDAAHGIGERAPLERGRREPQLAVPRADAVARVAFAHLERQHALRPERRLRLLVGDELRGAAELAVLRLPRRVQHRDRVAALAAAPGASSACQPRASSVTPRSAATRSCSTIAPAASSFAGDSVPQNGHTSFCFAGFHTASPPQAGQANFCCALSSAMARRCMNGRTYASRDRMPRDRDAECEQRRRGDDDLLDRHGDAAADAARHAVDRDAMRTSEIDAIDEPHGQERQHRVSRGYSTPRRRNLSRCLAGWLRRAVASRSRSIRWCASVAASPTSRVARPCGRSPAYCGSRGRSACDGQGASESGNASAAGSALIARSTKSISMMPRRPGPSQCATACVAKIQHGTKLAAGALRRAWRASVHGVSQRASSHISARGARVGLREHERRDLLRRLRQERRWRCDSRVDRRRSSANARRSRGRCCATGAGPTSCADHWSL